MEPFAPYTFGGLMTSTRKFKVYYVSKLSTSGKARHQRTVEAFDAAEAASKALNMDGCTYDGNSEVYVIQGEETIFGDNALLVFEATARPVRTSYSVKEVPA